MMKRRYNIGLLVACITDPFSNRLTSGAMKAAEDLDINLFIFPGKYLDIDYDKKDHDAPYEYQYTSLFAYAAKAKLDYLIVATGTICYACTNERKKEFLSMFDGTPCMSVAAEVEGYDFLQFDNKSGIIAAIDYLAQQQNRKNIGMMIGDLNNFECVERYNAYLNGLENNGLDYKKSYVQTSDISPNCREQAEILIDNNPELDAILCVNDMIATVVYDVLQERGKRVGRDIAVVGFDDLPFSARLDPPLSSVRADAQLLGIRAVEKAVNYLNGVEDNDHLLSTTFIPRQSSYCGLGIMNTGDSVFTGTKDEILKKAKEFLFDSNGNAEFENAAANFISRFFDFLDQRFKKAIATSDDFRQAVDIIDDMFSKVYVIIDNISKFNSLVDSCMHWIKRECPEENLQYLRRIHEYYYKRMSIYVVADYRRLQNQHNDRIHMDNLVIRDALMLDVTVSEGYTLALKRLHCLNIDTSYLFVFDKPMLHRPTDDFPNIGTLNFKAYCYGRDIHKVPEDKQKVTSPEIYVHDRLASDRRHTMVATLLFYTEWQYGMVLVEPHGEENLDELELITYQLSTSVKTIHLLKTQEDMLAALHSKNLALENESQIDQLTGIFNRRGFYTNAEELMSKPENAGKTLIICYGDMDNLKMVNDKYGHAEGDFSLKSLAECMKHSFGEDAVIARMGGDEYAVLKIKTGENEIEDIKAKKESFITTLNENSGKPYRINMSLGIGEFVCANSYDLQTALDKADGLLYSVKVRRKKEI